MNNKQRNETELSGFFDLAKAHDVRLRAFWHDGRPHLIAEGGTLVEGSAEDKAFARGFERHRQAAAAALWGQSQRAAQA